MTSEQVVTRPIDALADYVARSAAGLQAGYMEDRATTVATLARLRRALPTSGQLSPEAWELFDTMPEVLFGDRDEPSRAELAAVAALALFAAHQQSRRDVGMHQPGRLHHLGRAVARLAGEDKGEGVERRFRALQRSATLTTAIPHLRGLVTQLRGGRIPVDYGSLARDLYRLGYPNGAHAVHMQWARDFRRSVTGPAETGDNK